MDKKKVQGTNQKPQKTKEEKIKILQKRALIAIIILVIFLILYTVWFLFYFYKSCENERCFYDAINSNCKRVSYLRSDDQSSWLYKIAGKNKDSCDIQVQLLELKEGLIDISELQGKKMTCTVLKGDTIYPEEDVSKCTGPLKEDLQDILIKRMHNYLLQNVGEISEEFKSFEE